MQDRDNLHLALRAKRPVNACSPPGKDKRTQKLRQGWVLTLALHSLPSLHCAQHHRQKVSAAANAGQQAASSHPAPHRAAPQSMYGSQQLCQALLSFSAWGQSCGDVAQQQKQG